MLHACLFRVGRAGSVAGTIRRAMSSNTFTFPDGRRMQVPGLPAEIASRYKPGQMYKHQNSLPSLPVNPLEQTLRKYLQAVEPIVSAEELERTKKIVDDFQKPGGVGEKLQKMLLNRADKMDNWLIDWWNREAYLAYRESLVINVSPGTTFPYQDCGTRQRHVEIATKLTLGMLKVFQLVQTEALPPDVYRDKPYCMWQYPRLYGCRIPGKTLDSFSQSKLPENRHIIVMRKGHPYKLTLFYDTPNGEIAIAPSSFIMEQLHWIMEDARERPLYPVGLLTTQHRDSWFESRERLLKDPVNTASLKDIQSSIIMVCLDEAKPNASVHYQGSGFGLCEVITGERTLHGNGSGCNTINRWFDCTTQMFVGEDGGCGSILEHSALDGPAAIFSNKFALDLMTDYNYNLLGEASPVPAHSLVPARRLEWNLSQETIADIDSARSVVDKSISNVDFKVICFDEFGKDLPKAFKLSPDGFIQMAIQLTYYKLYNRSTATYESGGIRWFKYGRTDTIRSSTNASHAFVQAMTDPMQSNQRRIQLLSEAVKAHSNYTDDAISGRAIDRHLMGLRVLARDNGIAMPDIFTDTTYGKSLHFQLSTSQVPVPNHDIFLSFGAVVPDGYGVCYNPQQKKFLVCISSYYDCPETDSKLFASKLKESLREMKLTLLAAGAAPKSKL